MLKAKKHKVRSWDSREPVIQGWTNYLVWRPAGQHGNCGIGVPDLTHVLLNSPLLDRVYWSWLKQKNHPPNPSHVSLDDVTKAVTSYAGASIAHGWLFMITCAASAAGEAKLQQRESCLFSQQHAAPITGCQSRPSPAADPALPRGSLPFAVSSCLVVPHLLAAGGAATQEGRDDCQGGKELLTKAKRDRQSLWKAVGNRGERRRTRRAGRHNLPSFRTETALPAANSG